MVKAKTMPVECIFVVICGLFDRLCSVDDFSEHSLWLNWWLVVRLVIPSAGAAVNGGLLEGPMLRQTQAIRQEPIILEGT